MLDIWQRPMTDIGQTGTGPEKGKGAKFLILPPGSEDMHPEGYILVRSPTMQVWFATRDLDPDPKAADATVRKHKLYAWSNRDNPPETKFIPVDGRAWVSDQPDNLDYWKYLSDLYRRIPMGRGKLLRLADRAITKRSSCSRSSMPRARAHHAFCGSLRRLGSHMTSNMSPSAEAMGRARSTLRIPILTARSRS